MPSAWRRRVLVIDDDTIVRALVTSTLEAGGFAVIACEDVETGRQHIEEFDPDLVVLEASINGLPSGLQFGATVAKLNPGISLLYLTRYPTLLHADRDLATHVSGHAVMLKDDIADVDALLSGVEDALRGRACNVTLDPDGDYPVSRLNATQLEILNLVAQGLTNSAIAEQRGTRERTVERQLKSVYDCLGLANSRDRNARVVASMMVAQSHGWRHLGPPGSHARRLLKEERTKPHAARIENAIRDWQGQAGASLHEALRDLIEAIDTGAITGDELACHLMTFAQPSREISRAVDLLIISAYTPSLRREIDVTLGPSLDAWLSPGRDRATRIAAAQRAFILGLSLGYVTDSWRTGGEPVDLSHEAAVLAEALANPSRPRRLPAMRADHLDATPQTCSSDERWDAVFQATLGCVGELGFESSTLDVIAAAAGVAADAITAKYPSTHDLFLEASDRMLAAAVERNSQFQHEIEAMHSTAIADACMIRENMRPERKRVRTIALEQLRIAALDSAMQQVFREAIEAHEAEMALTAPPSTTPDMLHAQVVSEIAMTTGLGIVAQLRSDAWRLPLDTVLVPWRGLRNV